MSGQRSSSGGGAAASVAAGCALREIAQRPNSSLKRHDEGLAVFSWGRGEDGQLGLGDTR
jgi:alpha-tubulin suppressor-like RCC1 family protein